jgi:uncharacterized ubiquitin-like protein YukD
MITLEVTDEMVRSIELILTQRRTELAIEAWNTKINDPRVPDLVKEKELIEKKLSVLEEYLKINDFPLQRITIIVNNKKCH